MRPCATFIPWLSLSRRVLAGLLTAWLVLLGPYAAHAASGDLDPTFGVGGKVTTDIAGFSEDSASALVLQPDGKLVAAGFSGADFALTRYSPNGSLDSTFGAGGRVITNFGGTDWAHALVLQPDGKLVAAGNSGSHFALTRYNANGSPDLTFGGGTGKVTTNFGGASDAAFALVRQPDGKLVAAGYVSVSGTWYFALARYNANGVSDPAFGIGGAVTTGFSASAAAHALVLQPDGKLVAAGFSGGAFAMARYNADGSLDSAFGTGGKVTTDFSGGGGVSALVLQPDGKLVAAGNSGADFALARYNTDGTLDSTFGTGGKVITDFGDGEEAFALVVQPDGKLVAAGYSDTNFPLARYNGPDTNFALARYSTDGTLDSTFGTGGKVITDFGNPDEKVFALVVQPDGKLVAAGSSGADFAMARYQGGETVTTRALIVTKTGISGDPGDPEQRTFLTINPIVVKADYYDPADACVGVAPTTIKFFVFNLEGQLVLGRDRDTTGGVYSSSVAAGSKHQTLFATLIQGTLPPGDYNLAFRVQDCTGTSILVSEFYAIQVFAVP